MTHNYIVQRTQRHGDILVLTLVPNVRQERLVFVPGQYAAIGFVRAGRPTPMRCFSISNTPASGVLQFAMRVRGNFTQAAAHLVPGDPVRVQGPFGDFTIDTEYDRKIVMLAGGIGITPFLSMLRDSVEQRLAIPITLLFSNRSVQSIPFYEELRALTEQNPNLRIQFYSADANPNAPNMVAGSITGADVRLLTMGAHAGSTYFVCGPRGFSDGIQAALRTNGVHESRIVSESFTQASSLTFGSRFSIPWVTYSLAAAALVVMAGAVMVLDLSRTVPKLASAQAVTVQQTGTQSSQPSGDGPSNVADDNAPVVTTTPSQSPRARQQYQAPVSSVS